jgi:hypothetical protein
MAEGLDSGKAVRNRLVYRPEAIAAHRRARELSQMPRFMSSRTLALLWGASLASLGLGVALAAHPVPVHVPGTAVVVPATRVPGAAGEGLAIVAFFPPEAHARLAAGQRLLVDVGRGGVRVESRLMGVEPAVLSPEVASERFGLKARLGQGPASPAAYAFAMLTPLEAGLTPEAWLGSTFRVDVEVDQQRLLARVPVVGRLLEG